MAKCEFCRRELNWPQTHHLIPRYFSSNINNETMELCLPCHKRLDKRFENFINWGSFKVPFWQNPEKMKANWRRRWWNNREHYRQKNREDYLKHREDYLRRAKINYQKRLKG